MPLYDVDGTAVGTAAVTGPVAVIAAILETVSGGSFSGSSVSLDHVVAQTLLGSGIVTANTQGLFNVSGLLIGSGTPIDATMLDTAGTAVGGSSVTGNAVRVLGASGYAFGGSSFTLSVPEPIFGVAIVTAYMEVIHVPYPVCQNPQVTSSFRWGHTFTRGDLDIGIRDLSGNPTGPVQVSYTLYQMVKGCVPLQKGPAGRKPASSGLGCYYVTGTAGECGQPGMWKVQWKYQRTFGDPVEEKCCFFTVLDHVLGPVFGDTLVRTCKYGWGE